MIVSYQVFGSFNFLDESRQVPYYCKSHLPNVGTVILV
jgi:hypothetical protein